jgi:diphosphomevalonate decarboxylase
MSALALCLLSLSPEAKSLNQEAFYQKASEWARLGSGSASRSVFSTLGLWGKTEGIPESSDLHAIAYKGKVDPVFLSFKDTILLVEKGQKSVSSSAGHGLMNGHPFAQERFKQAHTNLAQLQDILAKGDLEAFGNLVEHEALTLHAMMMSSQPYFLLMKPNTLCIIDAIWAYRKRTSLPLYFTLDAGANVHMLYPESIEQEALKFVNDEIKGYLKNEEYICDQVGFGPIKLTP